MTSPFDQTPLAESSLDPSCFVRILSPTQVPLLALAQEILTQAWDVVVVPHRRCIGWIDQAIAHLWRQGFSVSRSYASASCLDGRDGEGAAWKSADAGPRERGTAKGETFVQGFHQGRQTAGGLMMPLCVSYGQVLGYSASAALDVTVLSLGQQLNWLKIYLDETYGSRTPNAEPGAPASTSAGGGRQPPLDAKVRWARMLADIWAHVDSREEGWDLLRQSMGRGHSGVTGGAWVGLGDFGDSAGNGGDHDQMRTLDIVARWIEEWPRWIKDRVPGGCTPACVQRMGLESLRRDPWASKRFLVWGSADSARRQPMLWPFFRQVASGQIGRRSHILFSSYDAPVGEPTCWGRLIQPHERDTVQQAFRSSLVEDSCPMKCRLDAQNPGSGGPKVISLVCHDNRQQHLLAALLIRRSFEPDAPLVSGESMGLCSSEDTVAEESANQSSRMNGGASWMPDEWRADPLVPKEEALWMNRGAEKCLERWAGGAVADSFRPRVLGVCEDAAAIDPIAHHLARWQMRWDGQTRIPLLSGLALLILRGVHQDWPYEACLSLARHPLILQAYPIVRVMAARAQRLGPSLKAASVQPLWMRKAMRVLADKTKPLMQCAASSCAERLPPDQERHPERVSGDQHRHSLHGAAAMHGRSTGRPYEEESQPAQDKPKLRQGGARLDHWIDAHLKVIGAMVKPEQWDAPQIMALLMQERNRLRLYQDVDEDASMDALQQPNASEREIAQKAPGSGSVWSLPEYIAWFQAVIADVRCVVPSPTMTLSRGESCVAPSRPLRALGEEVDNFSSATHHHEPQKEASAPLGMSGMHLAQEGGAAHCIPTGSWSDAVLWGPYYVVWVCGQEGRARRWPWMPQAVQEALGWVEPVGPCQALDRPCGPGQTYVLSVSATAGPLPDPYEAWVMRAHTPPVDPNDGWHQKIAWAGNAFPLVQELVGECDGKRGVPIADADPEDTWPTPPLNRVSVSDLQLWLRDPQAFYRRKVLKIQPPLMSAAQMWGMALHSLMDRFVRDMPSTQRLSRSDMQAHLQTLAAHHLPDGGWMQMQTLQRLLASIADCEWHKRQMYRFHTWTEVWGQKTFRFGDRVLTLVARADRIDVCDDGTIHVIDYKTGAVPPFVALDRMESIQLPIEAWLAQEGAYAMSATTPVSMSGVDPFLGQVNDAGTAGKIVTALSWWTLSLSKGCVVRTYPRPVAPLIDQYAQQVPLWLAAFAEGAYGQGILDSHA